MCNCFNLLLVPPHHLREVDKRLVSCVQCSVQWVCGCVYTQLVIVRRLLFVLNWKKKKKKLHLVCLLFLSVSLCLRVSSFGFKKPQPFSSFTSVASFYLLDILLVCGSWKRKEIQLQCVSEFLYFCYCPCCFRYCVSFKWQKCKWIKWIYHRDKKQNNKRRADATHKPKQQPPALVALDL